MKSVIPPPSKMRVGIVIATHAAVGFVHVGLECLKRHEPDVKVLVHDDFSDMQGQLRDLAEDYGAQFVSTPFRLQPTVGDCSAFVEGLRWGQLNNRDIVVKASRRLILNKPWSVGLRELMANMQYATATGACAYYAWGFRSELVAMHVPSWHNAGMFAMMEATVRENKRYAGLPEAWYHARAKEVHDFNHPSSVQASHIDDWNHPDSDPLAKYTKEFKPQAGCDGYVNWSLLGLSRHCVTEGVYWHDSHDPAAYLELSQSLGLPYTIEDFTIIPGE